MSTSGVSAVERTGRNTSFRPTRRNRHFERPRGRSSSAEKQGPKVSCPMGPRTRTRRPAPTLQQPAKVLTTAFAHRHQPGSGRRRCWWSTSSRGAGVTASGVEQEHDQWALRPTSPAAVTGRAVGAGAAGLETRGEENRRGASTSRRSHPRAEPAVRRRRQDTCRASPSESLGRDDQALPWPLHLPAERPSRSNRPRGGTRPRRRRVVVPMDHDGRTLARPAH